MLVGTCVYLFDRDWGSTQFLAPLAEWQGEQLPLFGTLGLVLPSFCHAYAFALLLIMALGRSGRVRRLGAAAWFAVAAGLELLQSQRLDTLFPESTALLAGSTVSNSLQSYIVNGRFDSGDLAAAALGCLFAYFVSSVLEVPK